MNKLYHFPSMMPTPTRKKLISLALYAGAAALFFSPEAFAVREGEMRESVTYVTSLLDNNIVPLILTAGVAGGAAFGFLKQNFTPLVMAMLTSVGYGFGHKWISTVYSLCV